MITLIVIVLALAATVPHTLFLWRQRLLRELIVFLLLMIPGAILTYMAANLYVIQEPLKFLEWFYEPINQLFSMAVPA